MSRIRSCCRPQLLALALLLAPGAAHAFLPDGVRPLTAAERQAALLAAQYLDRGPAAWWDQLAAGSPLRKLGREAALAEIEVRAGSPEGAEWTLETAPEEVSEHGAVFSVGFPSGADDTLVLGLVQEGGAWKIDSLRISAEPVAAKEAAEAAGAAGDAGKPAAGPGLASRLAAELAKVPVWLYGVAGGAALLLLAAAWTERRRRGVAAGLAVAGGLIAVAAAGGVVLPRVLGAGPAAAVEADAGFPELRSLLAFRRALTRSEGSLAAGAPPETRQPGAAGLVARLWWAQQLLGGSDLRQVDEALQDFPSPGHFPLAELLRARASFLRLEEVPTAVAFQRAADVGVAHEGLLAEAAQAFLLLGFDNHAKEFLDRLRRLGARQSDPWYTLAQIYVQDDKLVDAVAFFDTGWQLQPISRGEIFDQPLLTALLEDLEVRKLARLGAAAEPGVECEEAGTHAIPLPAGFEARLLGRTLRLTHGEAELRLPGGCDLAPAGTAGDPAGAWTAQRATQLLGRLPALLQAARAPGALAQPALRRRTEDTAEALAGDRRWADLLSLTDGLAADPASLPPSLVRLRAEALRRSGREGEARDLLIRLAKGNTAQRRTDPGTLYQLANLLSRQGSFDDAIKLVAKADSQLPFQADGEYLRQLQMEKRLAASSEVYRSPHFAIRYPPSRGQKFAVEAARILEAERTRLQAWIPVNSPRVIEVHLLPFDDFRTGYSPGMDVLGLYDGRVSVPLGDVGRFSPFVVSILTHELAHALITDRTADQAPRWLQEGLAQHVEMVQDGVNPISGYRDKENLVALPVLESAIGSLSPALVAIGYDEARWTLHYVEQRYGKAGIHRLLDAYRAGKNDQQAIQSAFGVPLAQFNDDLWAWATTEAPDVWKVDLVNYDDGKVTRIWN